MGVKTFDTPLLVLRAAVRPGSIDAERRTVELTWTTGARGRRWSWEIGSYLEELDVSESAVRLGRLNNGAPLLNAHNSWELGDVIGVVEKAWIEGGEGRATVRFSQREDADLIWRDVQDGILRNISVGYAVHRYVLIEGGDDDLPVYRATDWEPMELSIVPMGFDDGAKIRSAKPDDYKGPRYSTEFEIREAAEAEPVEPAAVADEQREITMPEEIVQEPAAGASNPAAVEEVRAAERKRCQDITALVRKVGLGQDVADDLIGRGVSVEAASRDLIDKLAERQGEQPETRPGIPAAVGVDHSRSEAKRAAMLNAFQHRCDPGAVKLEDNAREFRGMRLIDMARECIEMAGGRARGLSQREIAMAALGCDYNAVRAAGMMTTSDFPLLLTSSVERTLRAAYELAPQTWRPLGRQTTVADFREVMRVALGDIASLEEVKESGEYGYGAVGEEGAPIRVKKFGKIIPITWEAIVNDDLGAFTRIPSGLGAAAAQTESDLVWNLILSNPNFVDGKPIYGTDHGNVAGSGGAINVATLATGRAAMRKQKSKAGHFLNIAPQYLVVGPDKELEAFQYTSSNYVPAKSADINDSRNTSLEVISEARITGNPWFLFAAPGVVDTFEYAYLEGEGGVFIETRQGFEVDGLEIKARLVFGAGWVDYRGTYKNPGNS